MLFPPTRHFCSAAQVDYDDAGIHGERMEEVRRLLNIRFLFSFIALQSASLRDRPFPHFPSDATLNKSESERTILYVGRMRFSLILFGSGITVR
jgi:hypothetical protein